MLLLRYDRHKGFSQPLSTGLNKTIHGGRLQSGTVHASLSRCHTLAGAGGRFAGLSVGANG